MKLADIKFRIFIILVITVFIACNDIEIYVTSPDEDDSGIMNCDSTVFKLDIIQDGSEKANYTGFAGNNRLNFRITNRDGIDFQREVILKLEILKGINTKHLACRFQIGKKYQTSNIKLKKATENLEIYEIDINNFYIIN